MLKKNNQARQLFLEELPRESIRKVFLKILLVVLFFLVLSIITYLIQATFMPEENLFAILSFIHPFFILTLVLFYRGRIKEMVSQLFPKIANKSVRLILGILMIELLLGTISGLISFTLLRTPERWDWLEKYVHSGLNEISFEYLQITFLSFVYFLFIAFTEEFVFRFTTYRFLRRRSLLLALLVSSILFTTIHGVFNLNYFIFAIIIALYYEYTNFFVGSVFIHAVHNLFIVFFSRFLTYIILR